MPLVYYAVDDALIDFYAITPCAPLMPLMLCPATIAAMMLMSFRRLRDTDTNNIRRVRCLALLREDYFRDTHDDDDAAAAARYCAAFAAMHMRAFAIDMAI